MEINPAEDIAEEALKSMVKDGKIAHFIRNRKDDRLDKEGIDFLVFLDNGLALPIQVKTYNHRQGKCLRKHLKKHPFVKLVIFVRIKSSEKDLDPIKTEIENFIKDKLSRQ